MAKPVRVWCVLKWGRHRGRKDVQTHGPGPPAAAGWRRLLAGASLNSPRCPESRCRGLSHQSHLEKEGEEEGGGERREREGDNILHQGIAPVVSPVIILAVWDKHEEAFLSELNGCESDGARSRSKFGGSHRRVLSPSPVSSLSPPPSRAHIHSLKRRPPCLSSRPPSARSSCDRSMVIDGLPSVQIYTCKGERAFQGGESRAGDYIQSLSFCQREMESHYLTALFPPEHITLPSLSLCLSFSPSLPPPPHIACLLEKQNGAGTALRAEWGRGVEGKLMHFLTRSHSI